MLWSFWVAAPAHISHATQSPAFLRNRKRVGALITLNRSLVRLVFEMLHAENAQPLQGRGTEICASACSSSCFLLPASCRVALDGKLCSFARGKVNKGRELSEI